MGIKKKASCFSTQSLMRTHTEEREKPPVMYQVHSPTTTTSIVGCDTPVPALEVHVFNCEVCSSRDDRVCMQC